MRHSQLPRNGQYELFTHKGQTHCFDDLDLEAVPASKEMFEWLRSQPLELCRPMDDTDVAYYLQPELYIIWKLKWA